MPECIITYEPCGKELTGLVRYPDRMGEYADCWWVHLLAEIPVVPARTDGIIVPVRLAGDVAIEQVLGEVQRMLTRLCIPVAMVRHISPPMTDRDIQWMREAEAGFWKKQLPISRRRLMAEYDACHAQALDINRGIDQKGNRR